MVSGSLFRYNTGTGVPTTFLLRINKLSKHFAHKNAYGDASFSTRFFISGSARKLIVSSEVCQNLDHPSWVNNVQILLLVNYKQ